MRVGEVLPSRAVRLIGEYGEKVVIELAFLILHDQVNAEIVAEALRWLGHMEDMRSYQRRLWLLERSLFTTSARLRDGAALGLASLDDPHAAQYLREPLSRNPTLTCAVTWSKYLPNWRPTLSSMYPQTDPQSQMLQASKLCT